MSDKRGAKVAVPVEHQGFASWLRAIRVKKELTQEALSNLSGISQSQISDLENGTRTPRPEIIKKLSLPLCVSEGEILAAAGYKSAHVTVEFSSMSQAERKEIISMLVADLPEEGQQSAFRIVQEIHSVYRSAPDNESGSGGVK